MKLILASKSGVRKKILDENDIKSDVIISNVDEDEVKSSLIAEGADPLVISKNLAEMKSIKVSSRHPDRLVLGADWEHFDCSVPFELLMTCMNNFGTDFGDFPVVLTTISAALAPPMGPPWVLPLAPP